MLKIFRQQERAILQLCRTDDQTIPPAQLVPLLELARSQ
jgi:hypothetical protein